MRRILTVLVFVLFSTIVQAQSFELHKDLGNEMIAYQGIIPLDSLSKEQILVLLKEWQTEAKFDQKLLNEDAVKGEKNFEVFYTAIGKKSELGHAYNYRFTSSIKLEVKDNKLRYTITDFIKKTSPGEPGMSLENYIASYKPKISSTQTRDKAQMRLDDIEEQLAVQIDAIIVDLKKKFATQKEEW